MWWQLYSLTNGATRHADQDAGCESENKEVNDYGCCRLSIPHQSVLIILSSEGLLLPDFFYGLGSQEEQTRKKCEWSHEPCSRPDDVWGRTRKHCRSQGTSSLISSLNHIMHRRALLWPGNLTERCISHLQPYAIIVCTTQKVPGVRYSVLQSPYIRNDGRKPLRYATSFLWSERQVNEAE